MLNVSVGSTCSGFILKRKEYIEEIDSTALLFIHTLLGTPAFAIKNSDPNKTFCVSFQTLPEDSTGVPHILEHAVLMGSKKYPVKDVFGEIHKGGLMTFLNAMTGSDMTMYPFATRNLREYFNIMDVYCDVVFNPLLLPSTFEQEGWHYHKESRNHPLEFQGVVFNEMKGAFSDPIRAIFHNTFKGLLPGSTYAHESGGDPRVIPDLTYEQFVDFHRRFYHPSNAAFLFYGDANLEDELSFLQDRFLKSFTGPVTREQIQQGTLISQPVLIDTSYGVQNGTDLTGKTFLSVGSAVGTVRERRENTALQIIAQILYNSEASPLKKAILEAGLCRDFGGLLLANSCHTSIMMTYLIGSEPHLLEQFRQVYARTLTEMANAGLDRDLTLSELNKYEFSVREDMTKAQRGLDLIGKVLPALKHGLDPFAALRINDLFREIRTRALDDNYFEELIRDRLLDNPRTAEVILRPDPAKMEQSRREEELRLNEYEQGLDEQGLEALINRTQELMELQERPNDEATLRLLPRLSTSDLVATPQFHAVSPESIGSTLFLVNELPTNAISYVDFGFDCSVLPVHLLPWLDIFGTIVTEIGTKSMDYMHFARELGMYTGGFTHSFNTYMHQQDLTLPCRPILWFHLKCLSSYLDRALRLVEQVFAGVTFNDRNRIREIVLREFAWIEHSIQSEGYSLATSRVFAHLSDSGRYNEYVSGLTSYMQLKKLATAYDAHEEELFAALNELRSLLLRRQGLTLSMTGEAADLRVFQERAPSLINCLDDREVYPVQPVFQTFARHQGLATSAEVVYNVQGAPLFDSPDRYNGRFEVLKTWISRDYLWNTVRQMGGAYGCFVQFNHITGNIGLVSYRDPHIRKTYQAYEGLQSQISSLSLSAQVMDQLIIGTYGTLVPHQPPQITGAQARNDYLSGITVEFKTKRIADALAATADDLREFAPFFDSFTRDPFRTTIGNGDKVRSAAVLFSEIIDV